jgi:hypothetical protein
MSVGTTGQETTAKPREQKLVFYHPNNTGTGSALQLEPRVNRRGPDRYNCFFMEMAAQKTAVGRDGDKKVHATFDWENKLTVKLEFLDICELLAVLEGRQERAGGQRNGLYHETERASTVITLSRNTEKPGLFLGLSRKDKASGSLVRLHLTLSEAETVGLRSIFQVGLFLITFHTHIFPPAGE